MKIQSQSAIIPFIGICFIKIEIKVIIFPSTVVNSSVVLGNKTSSIGIENWVLQMSFFFFDSSVDVFSGNESTSNSFTSGANSMGSSIPEYFQLN